MASPTENSLIRNVSIDEIRGWLAGDSLPGAPDLNIGDLTHDEQTAADWTFTNNDSDKDIVFQASDAGTLRELLRLDASVPQVIVNNDAIDIDFRVKTSSGSQSLFVNGANGRVGINTSSPGTQLEVEAGSPVIRSEHTSGDYLDIQHNGSNAFIDVKNHDLVFRFGTSGDTEEVRIAESGEVGIGTGASPTNLLTVNSDSVRIVTSQTPATAGAAGNAGEIAWDSTYIYVCVATNTWQRVAHATW